MAHVTDGKLNLLLLPWPLRVHATDFHPLAESIQPRRVEPFGFFRFEPSEPFDVALVDRLLESATAQTDHVDSVVLPESSVPDTELGALEAVLSRHGVTLLIAGLREEPGPENPLASNWVHLGASFDGSWSHYRQDKHHRWSLDRSQIEQYHLDRRPRPSRPVVGGDRGATPVGAGPDRGDGDMVVSLVCEDLAHIDDVVEVIRDVGPTLSSRSCSTDRSSLRAGRPGTRVCSPTTPGRRSSP